MLCSVPPWPILPLFSSPLIWDTAEGQTPAFPFVIACILEFPHPKKIRLARELLSKWFNGTIVHFLSFINNFFIITLKLYVNRTVFQINLGNTLQDYKKPTCKEALNWILTAVVWVSAEIFLYPFFLPKTQLLEQWGGMVYVQLVNLRWDYEVAFFHEHRQNDCWIRGRVRVLTAAVKLGTSLDEGGQRYSSHKPDLVLLLTNISKVELHRSWKKVQVQVMDFKRFKKATRNTKTREKRKNSCTRNSWITWGRGRKIQRQIHRKEAWA